VLTKDLVNGAPVAQEVHDAETTFTDTLKFIIKTDVPSFISDPLIQGVGDAIGKSIDKTFGIGTATPTLYAPSPPLIGPPAPVPLIGPPTPPANEVTNTPQFLTDFPAETLTLADFALQGMTPATSPGGMNYIDPATTSATFNSVFTSLTESLLPLILHTT
jgi:hypothetical protein